MKGPNRSVVLFDTAFPRKTVTILPISSLIQKKTNVTDLTLKASDNEQAGSTYKNTITKDSFIRTEQIRSVSRHLLENKVGELRPDDMMKLDIYLIASLQLQNTVNMLIEAEIERRGMPA